MSVRTRALVVLALLGSVMLLSNHWFSVFEDEAMVIANANRSDFLSYFSVIEPYQHPPFSDFFLHYWLLIAGGSVWLIRLPFVLVYLAGIWCTAKAAETLGSERDFMAVIWISSLWPLGFHYGRAAGWYTLSFLLIALMTWKYLAWLKSSSALDLLAFTLSAIALVHTNYFGWTIIVILAGDFFVFQNRRTTRDVACAIIWIAIVALSFWSQWSHLMGYGGYITSGSHVSSKLLYGAYCLYAIFVSESAAPWFWFVGIPVTLAIAACLFTITFCGTSIARRYLGYFGLALAMLVFAGLANPKRLLFLCPWFLMAVALSTQLPRRPQRSMVASITLIAVAGFWGILDRNHYSTFHWIEPWERVSSSIVSKLTPDTTVIVSHPSALFYMFNKLPPSEVEAERRFTFGNPAFAQHHIYVPENWGSLSTHKGRVMLVESNANPIVKTIARNLDQECTLESSIKELEDRGWSFKRRFFPAVPQPQWRIEIREYRCR